MIKYNVYFEDNSLIINGNTFKHLEGSFLNEKNAKLFLKTISKEHPGCTFFIAKWDDMKNKFVK